MLRTTHADSLAQQWWNEGGHLHSMSKPRSSWSLDNTCGNVCMTIPYYIYRRLMLFGFVFTMLCKKNSLLLLYSMYCISMFISYGGFHKWWYPQNTPKWSFLVGKPMVVGYHHFRKPPYNIMLFHISFDVTFPCSSGTRWQSITCLMEQRLRAYGLGTSRGCWDDGCPLREPTYPPKKGTSESMIHNFFIQVWY